MLKNDTLKNGTSCIGLYGSALLGFPRLISEKILRYVNLPVNPLMSLLTFLLKISWHMFTVIVQQTEALMTIWVLFVKVQCRWDNHKNNSLIQSISL